MMGFSNENKKDMKLKNKRVRSGARVHTCVGVEANQSGTQSTMTVH